MISPRTASLLSLGALPAVIYYTIATDLIIAISAVNVLIISAALYLAFSPIADDHDHTAHA